nr:MAG TPA: hypothetical protein [Caudoviricetes sp.]
MVKSLYYDYSDYNFFQEKEKSDLRPFRARIYARIRIFYFFIFYI